MIKLPARPAALEFSQEQVRGFRFVSRSLTFRRDAGVHYGFTSNSRKSSRSDDAREQYILRFSPASLTKLLAKARKTSEESESTRETPNYNGARISVPLVAKWPTSRAPFASEAPSRELLMPRLCRGTTVVVFLTEHATTIRVNEANPKATGGRPGMVPVLRGVGRNFLYFSSSSSSTPTLPLSIFPLLPPSLSFARSRVP